MSYRAPIQSNGQNYHEQYMNIKYMFKLTTVIGKDSSI